MKVGALDYCFLGKGKSAHQRLRDTLEMARLADEIGMSRYWLSEHHGPDSAHSCPEIMASAILAQTQRIRVGSAGVLLRFYSPFKVAEVFAALDAMAPGRVDLGVGRGGADPLTVRSLLDGRPDSTESYDRKVNELASFLHADVPAPAPGPLPRVTPQPNGGPQVWVLGSGLGSAPLAARLGSSFSYGMFLKGGDVAGEALALYRKRFRPRPTSSEPRANVAVAGVCGKTPDDVQRILAQHQNEFIRPTVVGTPEECAGQIRAIGAALGVDEAIFAQVGTDQEDRKFAYRALCDELMG